MYPQNLEGTALQTVVPDLAVYSIPETSLLCSGVALTNTIVQ